MRKLVVSSRRRHAVSSAGCALCEFAAGGCGAGACGRDRARECSERFAAVHPDLAPEQVERLNAVRALVNRVEAVVAVMLLHLVVARVPVATEDLDRE